MYLYSNDIKRTLPLRRVDLDWVLSTIGNPDPGLRETYARINEAELLHLWEWKAKLKETLSFVVPCAECQGRRTYENIQSFTGILALDFDHLDDAPDFRDYLFATYPFIVAAWLSASKRGVKAFVRIPVVRTITEFKELFWGLYKVMNRYKGFDTATQNAVLPLFLSFDGEIRLRPYQDTVEWRSRGKNPKIDDSEPRNFWARIDFSKATHHDILDHLTRAIQKIDSNGHPQLRSAAYAAGGFVGAGYIDITTAEDLMISLILENDYLQKGTQGYIRTAKEMIRKGTERPLIL